jgi:hypothetical protein
LKRCKDRNKTVKKPLGKSWLYITGVPLLTEVVMRLWKAEMMVEKP